jgi:class 3 adenylate cyclase/tetratricopeptide (TPR) repeat protein
VTLVTCENCGNANKATAKFCAECGMLLARACPSCGAAIQSSQRFCDECGTPLNQRPGAAAGVPPGREPSIVPSAGSSSTGQLAERRVCSVLFCDLVGFTPLSEARDPEEVRELLSRYFDAVRTVIVRYGGAVEKFIGDAVMAVWGTPTATEQDAERAVRAALDLIDAVEQLGHEAQVPGLAARAGVVTGAVAVTVGASREGMVAGDAVNTAARVQVAAEPGTVLVDEGTWRVAQAGVAFTATGDHLLKGKTEPVPLWQAVRVLANVGGAQRIDGLEAPFVGRDSELRLVKELFHACEQRRAPRLVSVTGAAGVGKSRLGWEFEKYIDGLATTVRWHRGRCLSYGDGVAFWALSEMVRQRLQIAEEDPTQVAGDKLAAGVEQWLTDPAEREYVHPRLSQLLGVDTPDDSGHQLGREELFAGWRLFFERLAADTPVVMVLEDLQHADAGLLDFLEHLLDWTRDVPVFVLTLARPEVESRRPGWGTGRRNSTALTLDRLDDAAMRDLLEGLVPEMPLEAQAAISDRAEGIPLYAVETVRMLIDRDVVQPVDGVYRLMRDVGELAVPATLQSLLAARLDSLDPDARALVADAAVLGGSFPVDALIAVSENPESVVRKELGELVRREVLGVRADPLSPERGQYGFVQAMFRQVAYDTLSRRERKARHLAVARHLTAAFADEGEEIAEVIAAHLIDALTAVPDDPDIPELQERAVTMLARAGERAVRTGAPAAAAKTFATAADLLQHGTPEGDLTAARLHERAGSAFGASRDFATSRAHYRHALDIYQRHECVRDAGRAMTFIASMLRREGLLEDARAQVLRALKLLETKPDADFTRALGERASVEAFAGNAALADEYSALALAEAQALGLSDRDLAELLVTRGIAHALASRPTQASANFREGVRRAEAAHDGFATSRALLNLGDTLSSVDPPAAIEATRSAMAICRRLGDRYLMAATAGNLIVNLLMTGDWDEAHRVYAEEMGDDEMEDRAFAWGVAMLLALSGDRPRLDVALATLERDVSEDQQDQAATATALAASAALAGDNAEALRYALQALEFGKTLGLRMDAVRWAWPIAADAALALDDRAEIVRLLEWLDGHRPGNVPAVLRAERQRIGARLLATEKDFRAGRQFESAVNTLRNLSLPYHLAICLLDTAEYLAATGDEQQAVQLATEAGVIAGELGARPLLERAARLTGPSTGPSTGQSTGHQMPDARDIEQGTPA